MRVRPEKLSTRPVSPVEPHPDPLSDIIDTLRMSTKVHGQFELTAPFALAFEPRPDVDVSLLAVLRGTAVARTKGAATVTFSAGDVLLQSCARAIEIRDSASSRAEVRVVSNCPSDCGKTVRFEGAPVTPAPAEVSLVAVGLRLSPQSRGALLAQLPPLLVIAPDDSPALAGLASLLRSEATNARAGSRALLGRLSESIFIDILRNQGAREGPRGDLKALGDPPLARALALVHARPDTDWTIESLGRAAGLSRSAFAARFHEKVGEPPLRYVARWRMNRAAELLTESDVRLDEVALRVGYRSEASFSRAFARFMGSTPGNFRRKERAASHQ